jgi:hypothetical protein
MAIAMSEAGKSARYKKWRLEKLQES